MTDATAEDGGSSGSEGDNSDDEDEDKKGLKSINPAQVRWHPKIAMFLSLTIVRLKKSILVVGMTLEVQRTCLLCTWLLQINADRHLLQT
ncbi:unnamed protein product [Brassica oleracea]